MPRSSFVVVMLVFILIFGLGVLLQVHRVRVGARSEAIAAELVGHNNRQKAHLIRYVEVLHRSFQDHRAPNFGNRTEIEFPIIGTVRRYASYDRTFGRVVLESSTENGVSMEFEFDVGGRVKRAIISRGEFEESWRYWPKPGPQ